MPNYINNKDFNFIELKINLILCRNIDIRLGQVEVITKIIYSFIKHFKHFLFVLNSVLLSIPLNCVVQADYINCALMLLY